MPDGRAGAHCRTRTARYQRGLGDGGRRAGNGGSVGAPTSPQGRDSWWPDSRCCAGGHAAFHLSAVARLVEDLSVCSAPSPLFARGRPPRRGAKERPLSICAVFRRAISRRFSRRLTPVLADPKRPRNKLYSANVQCHLATGIVAAIVVSTIGTILLLIVLRLFNRRSRW
jgi:hypothetical protein